MARYLKEASATGVTAQDASVTKTVEGLLKEIETGGDKAVRELSLRFDKFDRESFRLTDKEIQACVDGLTSQERKDVEFAQEQVRNFAIAQRGALLDLEIETQPRRRTRSPQRAYPERRLLRAWRQVSSARVGPHDGADRQGRRMRAGHHLCPAV